MQLWLWLRFGCSRSEFDGFEADGFGVAVVADAGADADADAVVAGGDGGGFVLLGASSGEELSSS